METITDFCDERIQNILNIIKTKNERLKYERCLLPVLNDYLNNYIELLQILNLFQWKLNSTIEFYNLKGLIDQNDFK